MTVDLDHVFARVAPRFAHDREQYLIEYPVHPGIADTTVIKSMRF